MNKSRSVKKRNLFWLFVVLPFVFSCFLSVGFLPTASASTFGYTNIGAIGSAPQADQVRGYYYYLSDNADTLNYGRFYGYADSVAAVKIGIWFSNGTFYVASNPVETNTTGQWWYVNFTDIGVMPSGEYLIGVIGNATFTVNYDSNGNSTSSLADDTNNFSTPEDVVATNNYARTYSIYLDYTIYTEPTPTPSPTPSPTPAVTTTRVSSFLLMQYVVLFALSLVFSIIALTSDNSITADALAMLLWVVFAIANFTVGYTVLGSSLSYIVGLIGFIFAGNFVWSIIQGWNANKKSRFIL